MESRGRCDPESQSTFATARGRPRVLSTNLAAWVRVQRGSFSRPGRTAPNTLVCAMCLALALVGTRPVAAQMSADAGGTFAVACARGETRCVDTGPALGFHAGLRFADRITLRARYAAIMFDDVRDEFGSVMVTRRDRTRRLWLGELLYDFRSAHPLRPMVGISIGARRDRATVTCEPIACADIIPGQGPSVYTGRVPSHLNVGVLGGVGLRASDRLRFEGLVGVHNLPGEEGGTIEAALTAGVTLWRAR